MHYTVKDIANAIGAEMAGDSSLVISGLSEPGSATRDELALAMDLTYAEDLSAGTARAAVVWEGADWQSLGLEAAIFVGRPRYAMSGLTALYNLGPEQATGIHPSAVIDPSASVGEGASIGAFVVIGARAEIGKSAKILPQVTIAEDVVIGADALIYSGVRIESRVRIGDYFIAHPNVVIGGDGFSFVTPEAGAIEEARATFGVSEARKDQSYARISSTGSVQIGHDVEIGSSSSVDKGTISDTVIGDGTKMDSQVQVGHNVKVGRHCLLCAQVGIAGSSTLGDRVVLGGQSGVGDHINVGSDVIAGGKTAILANVPPGRVVMGYPAMKMDQNIAAYKALRRLPRTLAKLDALEKRVSKLPESD